MDTPAGIGTWRIRSLCAGAPVVFDDVHPALCPALRATILARSRAWADGTTTSPSYPSLNIGGWKSSEDFFAWRYPAVRELRDVLRREYLRGGDPIGWTMINRAGSHHPRHHHGNSVLSGVYYVDPGDPASAPTVFEATDGREVRVEPAAGRLALFPSDLWHHVPAYAGTSPRITIAFDVRR